MSFKLTKHTSNAKTPVLYLAMCIFALSLISACSKHQQIKHDLDALEGRLQDFTGISIKRPEPDLSLQLVSKSELKQDVPQIQINMRDFYAVDDCPLGQLIAERNTALGKMQQASTRFDYELRLLDTLQNCMQQMQSEHPVYPQMQSWLEQKTDNLPLVYANLMTQSDESYRAFSTAGDFISGTKDDSFPATKLALQHLSAISPSAKQDETMQNTQQSAANLALLEQHLQTLSNSKLPARMWRTQALLAQRLPPLSDLLKQYLAQTQCSNKQDEEEIKIMRNIFKMFFADKIQPLGAQLNHYQYQLNPFFEAFSKDENLPADFRRHIKMHSTESMQTYKTAMREHIETWQQVFALCE
uniref:DUF3080 family protein n=1 Tax=Ningiella ruwaisensis TaxID=2364274 RepID=UPI00109F36FA|nr:DUF3080 family protein [Ningiella ruwaisensis]